MRRIRCSRCATIAKGPCPRCNIARLIGEVDKGGHAHRIGTSKGGCYHIGAKVDYLRNRLRTITSRCIYHG